MAWNTFQSDAVENSRQVKLGGGGGGGGRKVTIEPQYNNQCFIVRQISC